MERVLNPLNFEYSQVLKVLKVLNFEYFWEEGVSNVSTLEYKIERKSSQMWVLLSIFFPQMWVFEYFAPIILSKRDTIIKLILRLESKNWEKKWHKRTYTIFFGLLFHWIIGLERNFFEILREAGHGFTIVMFINFW